MRGYDNANYFERRAVCRSHPRPTQTSQPHNGANTTSIPIHHRLQRDHIVTYAHGCIYQLDRRNHLEFSACLVASSHGRIYGSPDPVLEHICDSTRVNLRTTSLLKSTGKYLDGWVRFSAAFFADTKVVKARRECNR
jgi:hypothetical protein